MITEDYAEYLNSNEWQSKRARRLAMSNYQCEACRSKKGVEVHHLTYERIYHENMDDLLPLCFLCHDAAEDAKSKGEIPTKGDVAFLKRETIRAVRPCKIKIKANGAVSKNRLQSVLMEEPWFLTALSLKKKAFKQQCREHLGGRPYFMAEMSNACALYHRTHQMGMFKAPAKVRFGACATQDRMRPVSDTDLMQNGLPRHARANRKGRFLAEGI